LGLLHDYNTFMRRVVVLASPRMWQLGHGPEHPLKPERLQRTYELMDEAGLFAARGVRRVEPGPATVDQLLLFHTREYVEAVQALSAGEGGLGLRPWRFNFGPGDNPVFPGMHELYSLAAGAALHGAGLLVRGECDTAFSFGGGLHHAWRDHASGFCVYNDAVVAITWLVQQRQRVAYIDIDVHHGDGVQYAFDDSDRVLKISFHQDGHTLFPGTGFLEETGRGRGRGFGVNLPLPAYTDDEAYLWAFDRVVPDLVRRFKPDVVVTQLGVDTHYLDPLAELSLTTDGQEALFRRLAQLAPRWLALGGGGYNLDVVPRAWTLALAVMAEVNLPVDLPPNYRQHYGGATYHDEVGPALDEELRQRVRRIVEERVTQLRELMGLK
jgi:acetoin utilization protein AcuC